MLIVNPEITDNFESRKNIYTFINASITEILYNFSELRTSKKYWLFYYIKADFSSNLLYLIIWT